PVPGAIAVVADVLLDERCRQIELAAGLVVLRGLGSLGSAGPPLVRPMLSNAGRHDGAEHLLGTLSRHCSSITRRLLPSLIVGSDRHPDRARDRLVLAADRPIPARIVELQAAFDEEIPASDLGLPCVAAVHVRDRLP